jgi:hypothetical protein
MNNRLAKELGATLRRKRSSLLLQEIVGSQNEVEPTLEDRESELEESAQKDRMTRLESRLTERGQIRRFALIVQPHWKKDSVHWASTEMPSGCHSKTMNSTVVWAPSNSEIAAGAHRGYSGSQLGRLLAILRCQAGKVK